MKKALFLLILLIGVAMPYPVDLHVFTSEGCPACAGLIASLEKIQPDYPEMTFTVYEVRYNQTSREILSDFSDAFDADISHVPITFIDKKVIIGYSRAVKEEIDRCTAEGCSDPWEIVYGNASDPTNTSIIHGGDTTKVEQPLTLAMVLGAAAVDAVNPCAFAVLILLLATITSVTDRKKAMMAGFSFATAIYLAYLGMGLGLFAIIQTVGLSYLFYKIIGGLAIVVGVFNLKDYIKPGAGGFIMEVPMSWRPKMKRLIGGVTSVPGAFLIGLVVSIFLLPCTSGPYIVVLGLLANQTTFMSGLGWLLLYNLIFITPMIAITLIVYRGLTTPEKASKWRLSKVRYMHLFAGIIMIAMGLYIIFFM